MGEKSHTCPYCGKGFRRNSHLTRHLATHSGLQRPLGGKRLGQQVPEEDRPFSCSYCGKTFARSAHLARHQETHSGERPYKCTYCGKAFGRNSHLTRHHSTHTGERPYECGVCGKAFTRSAHVSVSMGSSLSEEQRKHVDELGYLLKKNHNEVSQHSLIQLVQEIAAQCLWYPEKGSLKLADW
ncbi:hypothetical protein E2320_002950 [Naja naja]|nr:hypothetical protein E2320_002950 [Naja naja]